MTNISRGFYSVALVWATETNGAGLLAESWEEASQHIMHNAVWVTHWRGLCQTATRSTPILGNLKTRANLDTAIACPFPIPTKEPVQRQS